VEDIPTLDIVAEDPNVTITGYHWLDGVNYISMGNAYQDQIWAWWAQIAVL
jgi:hypothetical protein